MNGFFDEALLDDTSLPLFVLISSIAWGDALRVDLEEAFQGKEKLR
jgi:hypothetical protein